MDRSKSDARTPNACTIEAPCKINLHLAVKEKRPDGFHELESLFACLALSDTLSFRVIKDKPETTRLSVDWELPPHECPVNAIPSEKNLVLRAVSLFRERTGFAEGLDIKLCKRIPLGAGLGGASSDAAASLLALNILAGTDLSPEELVDMAASLGSDVPFFIRCGAAYVGGRGELIEPLEVPLGLWVLLVKPPFFSDTASAYSLLDKARENASEALVPAANLSKSVMIKALKQDPSAWRYQNDFLSVLSPGGGGVNAEKTLSYTGILRGLAGSGAAFAGLSGSGSCCFGIFSLQKKAEKAEKEFSAQGIFTKLTFFLAHKPDPVVE